MKRFLLAALVPALIAPARAAGPDLAASWRAAWEKRSPAPLAPKARALQALVFQRAGFQWESEAKTALAEAESGLRAAGLPALSGKVYAEDGSPSRYGIRLEYLQDPYAPARAVESYRSGDYGFESDAQAALNAGTSNLTAAGYHVVLARTWRRGESPWDYFYTVDFVARRR